MFIYSDVKGVVDSANKGARKELGDKPIDGSKDLQETKDITKETLAAKEKKGVVDTSDKSN